MNIRRSELGMPGFGGRNRRRRRIVTTVAEGLPVAEEESDLDLGADPEIQDIIKGAQPYVQALLKEDATEDVETLRARIANHQRIRDSFFPRSAPWVLYDNKVRVLKAKLRAALQRAGEEREDRRSKWQWSELGKSTAVIGMAIGGALVALLINLSGAANRSKRGKKHRRRFKSAE